MKLKAEKLEGEIAIFMSFSAANISEKALKGLTWVLFSDPTTNYKRRVLPCLW